MAEKKTRTRRKADTKTKPDPAQSTLLTLFGKRPSDNGEPSTEPSSEADKPKTKFNARVIVRTTSSGASSVTGKRRREESGSPVVTPPRLRSRSPLVIPTSSPSAIRSSPPLVLSSSPPAVRSSSPVILDSPLSSPPPSPSPPRARLAIDGDTTDSDGLGLTTHPFFAKARDKPKGKLQRTSTDTDKGKGKTTAQTKETAGSQEAPIEIGEDDEGKSAPVHAFFKPRRGVQGKGKGKEKESAGERWKKAAGVEPAWPCSESIHPGRGTAMLEARPCPVPRRTNGLARTVVSDEATRAWAESYRQSQKEDDLLDLSTGWFDGWAGLRRPAGGEENIPPEHAAHPAIARLLDPTTGPQCAFASPSNASEVLGSTKEVDELKEWLHKLALKRKQMAEQEEQTKEEQPEKDDDLRIGPRRVKRIERDVIQTRLVKPKKRKERRDEYDPDMVVDDDFIEPDTEDVTVVYEKDVGNTMVVLGAPGIGKSAAIHACAQELGWSVFEVYAGIGRRGIGANGLAGLIGSVATNHTVGGGDKAGQESLILLDDVDQVFEQDTQFWSAVESLIGDSKRAVVMTCNDMYAVREGEIAIQKYLELDTADPELASSYLYAQARAALKARGADTKLPTREAFQALYKATAHSPRLPDFAVPDMATHPVTSQMDRLVDLRRALEEVKFWVVHGQGCVSGNEHSAIDVREAWEWYGRDVIEHVGDWSVGEVVRPRSVSPEPVPAMRLWRFADALSWVDAWMERRWTRQMQASEVDRTEPTSDDTTTAYLQLCKPPVLFEEFGIAEYNADADMALAALCLARRRLERGAGSGARVGLERVQHWDSRWLDDKRLTHQESCQVFLEKHILSPTLLPPRPGVVLDIVPVVRRIVAADDAFEAVGEVREERRTRTRAGRQKYVRYLTLQEPKKQGVALEMIRATEYRLM